MKEWIPKVEELCQDYGVDHRFVGGTVTELIGKGDNPEISVKDKTIRLDKVQMGGSLRDDGTVKDLDMIAFGENEAKITELRNEIRSFSGKGVAPFVSLESANYETWGKPRNKKLQFVNTFEVDEAGSLSLNFRSISQPIKWESVEPWKMVVNDEMELTVLNPYAQGLCYVLRAPSGVKPKDTKIFYDEQGRKRNKLSVVMETACKTKDLAKNNGSELAYHEGLYKEWLDFIRQVKESTDLEIRFMAWLTGVFWTYGEGVSHGRGPFKLVSQMSDKLTG